MNMCAFLQFIHIKFVKVTLVILWIIEIIIWAMH